MCGTCHQYYQRTGHVRPTTAPARRDGAKAGLKYNQVMKNNSRPPKGMYINHDDLVTMATGPNTQGEHLLKSMDREIISYKRVVSHCIYENYSFLNTKDLFLLKLKNGFTEHY